MKVYAKTSKILTGEPTVHGWDVIRVPSDSNPTKFYTVDITHGRCDCASWRFISKGGVRKPCKHLKRLGFVAVSGPEMMEIAEPNTSKAKIVVNEEL